MSRQLPGLWVFDFNGVIIADTQACFEADCNLIRAFGGRPPTIGSFRDNFCIPAIRFYMQYGCKEDELLANPQKLGEVFHSFYEPRAKKCRTRRGIKDLLRALNERSIPAILLSNHTFHDIQFHLKRLKLQSYFLDILANSDGETAMLERNKQEKLRVYLEMHGFEPRKSIIIGDTVEEIVIGKNSG